MITTLNKTLSTRRNAPDNRFWFSLPSEAVDLLGERAIIRRDPITKDFLISKPNIDSKVVPTIISPSRVIRVRVGLVDEWVDKGDYLVDIDKDNECVTLIKI